MLVNSSRRIKKKITINVKYFEIIMFIYSLSVFVDFSYFTWDSYPYHWVGVFMKSLKYLSYFLIGIWSFSNRQIISVTRRKIISFFLVVLVVFCNHFVAENISLINRGDLIVIIDVFILLFLLGEKERLSIFKYLIVFFLILTLPSVIYYLLSKIISIPFEVLQSDFEGKIIRGFYYKWRPFGLIINTDNYYGEMSPERICGIFDEPGVVGTFAALFLGANYQRKPKINLINVLLLIDGLISFSLAFYILIFILIMVELAKKSVFKLVLFSTIFLIAFFVFMNIEFDNKQLSQFQSRFDLKSNEGTIVVNNRYDTLYEEEYDAFIDAGGVSLFFGKGYNASSKNEYMKGASVYTRLIYDYGIVGTILYLSVFVLFAFLYGINKGNISFILMFFVSVYQRPYILNRHYILLFISALCFIKYYSESANNKKAL